MPFEPNQRRRQSLRLRGYDYTRSGAYFVTICTQNRLRLLGRIVEGEMRINPWGGIVQQCWDDLPHHYSRVILDAFVVMPDHVHGVIVLIDGGDAGMGGNLKLPPAEDLKSSATNHPFAEDLKFSATPKHPLSEIVRALKTFSARRINEMRGTPGVRVWQRSYHEHIVRDDAALDRIRRYIRNNPQKWHEDRGNTR